MMLENPVSIEEASLMIEGVKKYACKGRECPPLIVSFEGALRDTDRTPQPKVRAPKAVRQVLDSGLKVEAIGFSCTEPETIVEALR